MMSHLPGEPMLTDLKFSSYNVVPKDGQLCKMLFFSAGEASTSMFPSKSKKKSVVKLESEHGPLEPQFKLDVQRSPFG